MGKNGFFVCVLSNIYLIYSEGEHVFKYLSFQYLSLFKCMLFSHFSITLLSIISNKNNRVFIGQMTKFGHLYIKIVLGTHVNNTTLRNIFFIINTNWNKLLLLSLTFNTFFLTKDCQN